MAQFLSNSFCAIEGSYVELNRAAQQRAARVRADAIPEWERDERDKRERHILRQYGMLPEEHRDMLAQQDGKCAICKAPPREPYTHLVVDHCHGTGVVRGLLCPGCNTALGMIAESAETARVMANYIERNVHPNMAENN